MKRLILLTCLLTAPIVGQTFEENLYKQHGEHKIFYSAFGSLFIDPKIAVAKARAWSILPWLNNWVLESQEL